MYTNETEPKISLRDEFNGFFLQHFGIHQEDYIIYDWLNLVNSLNLTNLIKLGELAKAKIKSKDFVIKPINTKDISEEVLKMKIFNITFIKNETAQWDSKYKSKDDVLFKTFIK